MNLSNKRNIGYVLNGGADPGSPASAATYIFGTNNSTWSTVAGPRRIPINKAGIIKSVTVLWYAAAISGSNESVSMYIRLNSSTDTLIKTVSNTSQVKTFNNAALSIAVVDGDFIEIKLVCPTWTTNPTNVSLGFVIYIE